MKYVATKNIIISIKNGNKVQKVQLIDGKVVPPSKLKELSKRQIRDYTKELYEGGDLSFLTTEDKRFYNKNKNHPDMQWALGMMYEE